MDALISIILNVVHVYQICVFVRCILSFLNPMSAWHRNPIVQFIYQITDPLLDGLRNAFPALAQGGIDFSPIVLIFLIEFTVQALLNVIR